MLLHKKQEEVIQMRFFSQPTVMSYKLMAERLGVTRHAVKRRQHRALLAMRLRMAAA